MAIVQAVNEIPTRGVPIARGEKFQYRRGVSKDPQRPTGFWDLASKVLDIINSIVTASLDAKVITLLCLTFLGFVWLLPTTDRIKARPSDFFNLLNGDSPIWIFVAGGLAAVLLVIVTVASVALYIQHQRNKKQGEELQAFRNAQDPQRLTSTNLEELVEYPNRVRERHALVTREDTDTNRG